VIGWRGRQEAIVGNLPLFHSFGLNVGLWIPLMTGTRVVYLTNPLDAAAVGRAIAEQRLTLLCAAPTFLQAYLRKCTPEQLASLRLVVTGAEKLRHALAERCREVTGLAVVEGYGCTECAPVVAVNLTKDMLTLGVEAGPIGSVGMAMPGICVDIVDPETRKPLPPNNEGLMLVKGPNVMQGYLDDPAKTAEALRDGWYDTGDIARMDADGRITITGRLSRFSKIGGEMVPHEGVEAALHEALASEDRVFAVCGVPDPAKGERLLVFHVAMDIAPAALTERLRAADKLPNLWIPRPENFRQVEALPLLGSGKIDLKQLQKMAEEA
jgi:acyl-[acyl-carrier-protein]-phospholipid O-acyltransferase/long-chain-fatty-acid--[acyl-carrier-protein] ligase